MRNEGQMQLKAPSTFKFQESAYSYVVDTNPNYFLCQFLKEFDEFVNVLTLFITKNKNRHSMPCVSTLVRLSAEQNFLVDCLLFLHISIL